MFLHPFKTGDYIKTASDIEGTVVEIGLFFTTLRMADNKIITIPNGNLSAGNIINYNVLPVRRLSTTVGIAYEADTARAIELLTALIKSRKPLVNPEKALVYVKELGDSSVVLGLHYWVKTDDYWDCLLYTSFAPGAGSKAGKSRHPAAEPRTSSAAPRVGRRIPDGTWFRDRKGCRRPKTRRPQKHRLPHRHPVARR